jgi:hypothetical protein
MTEVVLSVLWRIFVGVGTAALGMGLGWLIWAMAVVAGALTPWPNWTWSSWMDWLMRGRW